MSKLLDFLIENFELILTALVFISAICYVIDKKKYRGLREKMLADFRAGTENEVQRQIYLNRLIAAQGMKKIEEMPAHFVSAQSALQEKKALNEDELQWLKKPVFQSEKNIDAFSGSFWILLIIWLLRSFVFEPFRIPSGSMEPTLYNGDFIIVDKFSYGLRLPVLRSKITPQLNPIKRGDVVVFRYPLNPKLHYIKRVIGLPNDKIEVRNGQVMINGQIAQIQIDEKTADKIFATEALPDKSHKVQFYPQSPLRINLSFTVPEGHYFMMGDNRDGSEDSRSWGYVQESHLVGKAHFIWLNSDCISFKGNCNRIGTVIK